LIQSIDIPAVEIFPTRKSEAKLWAARNMQQLAAEITKLPL